MARRFKMAGYKGKRRNNDTPDGYQQFKSMIRNGIPGRLYIFYGEEKYLLYSCRKLLRKKLIDGPAADFNYHRFDGETFSVTALEDAVEAPPVFGEHTLIELIDINPFGPDHDKNQLASILSDIPDYCTIVFLFDTTDWKPDKRSRNLWSAINEHAEPLEFQVQSEHMLTEWIRKEFQRNQFEISPECCRYLIQQAGSAMQNLASEIDKLKSYCSEKVVTNEDIDAIVIPVLSSSIYMITDAIGKNDYDRALSLLQEVISQDAEPIRICAAIGGQFRQLLTAKILMENGKGSYELVSLYGLYEKRSSNIYEQARSFKREQLISAVKLCAQADLKLKSFSGNDTDILKDMIIALSQLQKRH